MGLSIQMTRLTKQFKIMDVLGCNKAMTTTVKQAIGNHQMNLQKGAGGQKFH